ncbi:MAG: choice-of-anchor J domain-containing protein [Bacteroidaceae bacterium]|nr:choice-of-anchor J domain-containing protein [Bacteroidaceae bacterium]
MKGKTTFLARASMMLLAVLFSLTGARADEFTVYADGEATSSNVPVEGYWADSYQKSEFVIAQAELTALAGNTITQMTFYLSSPASVAWGGNFQVFMKEVDEATISAYSGTDDATLVFEGPLDATQSTMTLEFDQPYTYNGGNLLVGVYQTVKGTYKSASFAGAEVEGASIQGHSSNSLDEVTANQKNFIPKTTFTYTIGGFDGVLKPTGLKVNYDGGLEATVSWVSEEKYFDIDVNDVVTENIEDNPYTLTGLDYGTTYTVKVRAKKGEEVSSWSSAVTFTTEYGALSLPYNDSFEDGIGPWTLVDCHASTGVSTNGGGHESTYSFAFRYNTTPPQYLISPEFDTTAPINVSFWYKTASATYPETFQVGYSATKDVDAFTWEDEVTATDKDNWTQYETTCPAGTKFVAIKYNSNDMYYLYVDDFSFEASDGFVKPANLAASEITKNSVKLSWTEKGEATAWVVAYKADGAADFTEVNAPENPFTLTGLTPETEYIVKVRQAGETDKWSDEITFTTDVAFPAPTDIVASNVTAQTAEISWTGNAEATGYNLRYKESGAGAGGEFVSDFEDSSFGEWTTIDADGDGYNWVLGSACGGIYLVEGGSLAGNGNGGSQDFVVSGSYSNVEGVGALSPDNWLVSPLVTLGGSISFYAGGQDASYANEYFGVFVSTTSNTDPAAFTQLDAWTLNADGTGTRSSRRKAQGVWGLFTVDLSAYAGQTGYVAIRHFNCTDQFMLNIDDITIVQPVGGEEEPWTVVEGATSPYTISGLTPETKYQVQVQAVYEEGESQWAGKTFTTLEAVPTPSDLVVSEVAKRSAVLSWTENGEATAWEICLNDDEEKAFKADSNPFTLEGLTPETEYTAKVRAINGEKNSRWSAPVSFTTAIAWPVPTDLAASNVTSTSAEISWTADADATGVELQWAEGEAGTKDWYQYDNGTLATSIGLGGGAFYWGVMFPAGSYTGSTLSKVAVYDPKAMEGTITIYNDGDTAPENAVSSVPVTFTGAADFIEVDVNATIDPTKNVWVVVYNESGTDYPASASADTTNDPNGRWISTDGSSWMDVASAGLSGYSWMVRAEIGSDVDPSTLAWTTVDEATSPFELTGLNPETSYAVRVKSIFEDGESQWTITGFKTLTNNPVPYNIAADLVADGATLTWNGEGESYNVQYRSAESTGATFFEDDFNNGLDQWTIVTAGEGPGWVIGTESGGNAATAYSWNGGVSYNADNWLISPAVELGGIVKFTTLTNSSYPDSYEVLLSTTGTETTDFTETLQDMKAATSGEIVTIDLTAYAGQTGYIAIHHVSYDCYLLVIDDFGVYEYIPASAWQEMAVTEKTATISGLATNNLYEYQIQSVKGGSTSEWSKLADFALLTLDSEVDNSDLINTYNGKQAHVTLANRTFYKDGKWNTVYLPFDMTLDEVAASPLADADVRTLTNNITVDGNDVTLNFTAEGEALTTWGGNMFFGGVPYIVKWASGSNIDNPEFANVTITKSKYYVGDDTKVMFVGTYAPIEFTADDTSILFVGADNKLNYPMAGATIGAFCGYFQLVGMTAESGSGVKFYTNLDDEDPTGIAGIETTVETGDWYDLSGRKLSGKPAQKGIYVNGGRKVTVK